MNRTLAQSRILSAVLIFFAINLALGIFNRISGAAIEGPARIAALSSSARNGDTQSIYFVGSSMIGAPLYYLYYEFDPAPPVRYSRFTRRRPLWRANFLEKQLQSQKLISPNVALISIAKSGALVSDFQILANKYIRPPATIYLFISPRDVCDMAPIIDEQKYPKTHNRAVEFLRTGWNDAKANLYAMPLYDYKEDIIQELQGLALRAYGMGGVSKSEAWATSLEEYSIHYSGINANDERFFEVSKSLEDWQRKGIDVLIVNVPLARDNLELMPAGFYDQYLKRLTEIATQHHVKILELGKSPAYDNGDFHDTAHLNARGGRKMLNSIFSWVKDQQSLRDD